MIRKVRKLRAKTYGEFCDRFEEDCTHCPFHSVNCGRMADEPCKPNGKYILREVKE